MGSDPSLEGRELYSTAVDKLSKKTGAVAVTTRDRDVIRRWAARHRAEPATGEATASGPATTQVTDGGTGLRFNFPGFAPFRSITWDEWFGHFDEHGLAFVYEEDVADRAYALWQARGAEPGHDCDDWFEAERQMGGSTGRPMGRYRIVPAR
jgi:Protein of unknown function (DUF2934)